MTEPTGSPPDQHGSQGAIRDVISGLRSRPDYLLVFAAILLYFFFCVALINAGLSQDEDWLAYIAIGGFIFGIFAAVYTVRLTFGTASPHRELEALKTETRKRERYVGALENTIEVVDRKEINTPDDKVNEILLESVANIRKALSIGSNVFRLEIKRDLENLRKETARWAEGVLLTPEDDYERILLHLYRNAHQTVFATSQVDYMEFWINPGGDHVVDAHKEAYDSSGCKVTRVFLFNKLDDVTPEYVAVMKSHSQKPFIEVRVLIAEEVKGGAYAQKLMRDFVIIDGETDNQAIGVTESFFPQSMRASWTFGRDGNIEESAESIREWSAPLSRIEPRLPPSAAF